MTTAKENRDNWRRDARRSVVLAARCHQTAYYAGLIGDAQQLAVWERSAQEHVAAARLLADMAVMP